MKLWPDNETRVDLVGFEPLVETVAELVTSREMLPVTVGVFGDWGGGKTSLMAMIEEKVSATDGFITVAFQPWLHKDYDDVRGALMVAISDALEQQRPVWEKFTTAGIDSAKKELAKFRRRIDWMRVAMFTGKAGLAFASAAHLNPAAVLLGAGALSDLPRLFINERTDDDGGNEGDGDRHDLLKPEGTRVTIEGAEPGPRERTITEFRSEFGALLSHLGVHGLVVFIDDLDRCSPEAILDTLEAIKLFFSVPGTAFVVGADQRIIRHALATRYPETGPDAGTLGREYLEKIIQVPVQIPPLSATEIEAYLYLLVLERHLGRDPVERTRFDALRAEAVGRLHRGLGGAAFNYGVVKEKYGADIPPAVDADLLVVSQIAPVLAPQLKGNPRQAKRFLNTLYLRDHVARRLKLSLDLSVLAKLSALEYFDEPTFIKVAEWNDSASGASPEISTLERWSRGKGAIEDPKLQGYAVEGRLKEWLRSEPQLTGKDLGGYLRFSREKLKSFGGRERALPPDLQELVVDLLSEADSVRSDAHDRLSSLDTATRDLIFDALLRRLTPTTVDEPLVDALVAAVRLSPEMQTRLASGLRLLPAAVVPIWLAQTLRNTLFPSSTPSGPVADVMKEWAADARAPLATVAKRALQPRSGRR